MLLANVFSDLTEWLEDIAGNWWFLFIIFGIALADSVIPLVPSETCVILGGIAAGISGELPLVILAGALGAFIGDNVAYEIGNRFSDRVMRFAATRPKFANRIAWAREQIRQRGGPLLITARFIPGGRTALTITSGITKQSHRWFAGWIAVAAVIWATYASLLGAIGKETFKDNHTAAFLLAFGAAVTITVGIEVVRHFTGKKESIVVDVVEKLTDQPDDSGQQAAPERTGEPNA